MAFFLHRKTLRAFSAAAALSALALTATAAAAVIASAENAAIAENAPRSVFLWGNNAMMNLLENTFLSGGCVKKTSASADTPIQ